MALFSKRKLKNQRPTQEVCQADSVQNAASTLLANIRFSAVDEPLKTIAITSSAPNEGKTTVALSLAIAAGRSGSRVLIIEGDMRRRSLRTVIGAKPRFGIHSLLTGKCTIDMAVVTTPYEGVWFLDAEAGIPNPDGILSSKAYTNMLEALRTAYDYVVIDTPPITAFPDASIVSSKTDAVVLVAREKYTDKREIAYALQQLRAADANVLGVALNCQDSAANGAYGYYYGYYYDEKTVPANSPEAAQAIKRASSGDTSVSVRLASDAAFTESKASRGAHANRAASNAFQTTGGGPTAAAPGSRQQGRQR